MRQGIKQDILKIMVMMTKHLSYKFDKSNSLDVTIKEEI